MNCKPGDLAAIVCSPVHEWLIGRTVTVLHAAPRGAGFELPDGFHHAPTRADRMYWVCEFPSEIAVPVGGQLVPRMTRFAPVPDAYLRPIRDPGDDATDEVIQRTGKLEGVPA